MHFASTVFWKHLWSSATLLHLRVNSHLIQAFLFLSQVSKHSADEEGYLGLSGWLVISNRWKGCKVCSSFKLQQQLLSSPDLLCHKQLPRWTREPPTSFNLWTCEPPTRPVQVSMNWGDEIQQSHIFRWVPLEGIPKSSNMGQNVASSLGKGFL